jgi:transaldolase
MCVIVFKKAYQIYQERGYRIRLLSAAFRNHMHWSGFIGGDVVISPPYAWQVRYNASDIPVVPRIDKPVDPKVIDELSKKFADFRRAYTEDGLSAETFDSYGPTRRSLRQFIAGCGDLGAKSFLNTMFRRVSRRLITDSLFMNSQQRG